MKQGGATILLFLLIAPAWGGGPGINDVLVPMLLFGNEATNAHPLNADTKSAVSTLLKRAKAFNKLEPMQLTGAGKNLSNKRLGIQRAIYSLFDRPDSIEVAREFTRDVRLLYEWEGMPDSPLSEAQSAGAFLKMNPKTPIAPYVHLFIGHRELCAVQFSGGKGREALRKDARAHLEAAKASGVQLIAVVASDLLVKGNCYPN